VKAASTNAHPARWSVFDLAEGFHLACALVALDRHGILKSLAHACAVRTLAARHRIDRGMLEAALQMLAARTDLIARNGDKYRLTRKYDAYARFAIGQYLRTYGANAIALDRILPRPGLAAALIDLRQHPIAFLETPAFSSVMLGDLIVQLGFNHVLDLGSGTGILLHDLAVRVPKFVGWGLDINPVMCAAARKRVRSVRAAVPIKIIRGDCYDPKSTVPAAIARQVRTITAASVANEFFGAGTDAAVAWLANLKKAFPGRILLIGDYYGRLGHRKNPPRHIALHDFVQVISGQGVPPPTLAAWRKIYRAAGVALVHAIEDRGASCFVHLIKL
jgi:SAM-dependent methyltransferase